MNWTLKDYLHQTAKPWITLSIPEKDSKKWNPSSYYNSENQDFKVVVLRSWKMKTVHDLMNEFGAAFQFFEEFRENWNALEELLNDLDDWMPAKGYVLIVPRAHELLINEKIYSLSTLLKTLENCGKYWSKPIYSNKQLVRKALPFQTLFLTDAYHYPDLAKKFKDATDIYNAEIRYGS